MFKKKCLTFEEVKFNEDVRIQIVRANADYKIDMSKKIRRRKTSSR